MKKTIQMIMNTVSPAWGVCGQVPRIHSGDACAGAASAIVALFPYYLGEGAYTGANLSRYAAARDYHDIVFNRLRAAVGELEKAFPGESFQAFTDNSPVREVEAAARCGLGVRGDNNLLIHPVYGSWVFIGEIVTSLPLGREAPGEVGVCERCGACRRVCPTGALTAQGFEKTRCLSFITQKKGVLTPAEEDAVRQSGCAWGCDLCQLVCPMNANAKTTPLDEFRKDIRVYLKPEEDSSGRAYAWRGTEVLRRNLEILEKKG